MYTNVPTTYALGLDVGHSAVKVTSTFHRQIIKTAVCHAIQISDESEARRALNDTYDVPGGGRYFVGDTALVQGVHAAELGLSDGWIETPEYAALMLAGVRKVKNAAGGNDPSALVMGLPASLYARQKQQLLDLATSLFGTGMKLLVVPQSYAPYAGLKLNNLGMPDRRYANTTSLAVIEVGYYTTDFAMIIDERPVERANVSCSGVRVAVEALARALSAQGIAADTHECEQALAARSIKHFGQQKAIGDLVDAASAALVTEVADAASRLFEQHARKMDAIVLAGGGARLVEDRLRSKWPNMIVPEDARFAVAEGLRRIGEARLMTESR